MSSIALRRLHPQPSRVARRPGRDRSRTIGVLILDPASFATAPVLSAIQAAARAAGYLVSIVNVPLADSRSAVAAVRRLRDLAAEGILLIAPGGAIEAVIEVAGDIPVVAIGAGPRAGVSTVTVDHYGGAASATRHLLGLGNRTVFHVSGPPGQHDSSLRLAGWRDTLVAAGAEVPLPLIGDWSPARGYALGCRLGLRADVTAIFVAGDQMALGVLRALHELERRVPEEVSVVGFDCIPHGEFFTPPLTTVRQDFTEMGRRSFELLSREIELGRQAKIHHTIPTELILRASTATADRRVASSVVPAFSGSGG
jgi:DNA-binding LacI/PurR family transcriptional regulator